MGRRYPVTFDEVSITVAQDIFEIFFGSSIYKSVRIIRHWLSVADTSLPASGFLPLRSRILPSTVTNGTGGTSANIGNKYGGDSGPSFTAHCNNTTKAVTSGTASIEYEDGFHLYQGHEFMYDSIVEIHGGTGASFVLELLAAPSAAIKFSGGVIVEENG